MFIRILETYKSTHMHAHICTGFFFSFTKTNHGKGTNTCWFLHEMYSPFSKYTFENRFNFVLLSVIYTYLQSYIYLSTFAIWVVHFTYH